MTDIDGAVDLLQSIAGRLQNHADGLSKEFLLEVADKLKALEKAARVAGTLCESVPRRGKGAFSSIVRRDLVWDLVQALNDAGHYGKLGDYVKLKHGRKQ